MTRSLGKELGSRNIRVNSINPGMVETEGTHSAGITESDFRKQTEATTPLGRIAQPQDIAPAVVFLASSDAAVYNRRDTLHHRGDCADRESGKQSLQPGKTMNTTLLNF